MRLMYIDVVSWSPCYPACSLQPWSHDAIDHLRRCRKRPRDLHVAVAVGSVGSVGSDLKKTMQIWCEKSMANLMANLLCEKIRHRRIVDLSWSICSLLSHDLSCHMKCSLTIHESFHIFSISMAIVSLQTHCSLHMKSSTLKLSWDG